MKKILLIAYSYPPLSDAQSLRWYYISNELAKLNYKIDIITIKHPENLIHDMHENIFIHRVYAGLFETIAYKFKNKIGVDNSEKTQQRSSFYFIFMKKMYWFFRSLFESIVPGNITTEWYLFAKHYIKKNITLEEYSYLITSHEPAVDSLLGLYIKKQYPKLMWVADFADPYVSIYTPKYKLFFENIIERKLYQKVDKIIFTNSKVKEILENKYSFLRKKNILILEQGFVKQENIQISKNKSFTMLYTGTFYKDFRNPTQLSKALKELGFDFTFIVAGRNEQFNYLFESLESKYKHLGFISHKEALQLQNDADILVHLSNQQVEQVPGKFFEYIGANKPILVIYQNSKDQLINLCKELNITTVCQNSFLEIKNTIYTLYQSRDKKLPYNQDAINEYSWENRAKKLKTFLESKNKL